MFTRIILLISLNAILCSVAAAQTTPATTIQSQTYIFSGDDIMSVLTPQQRAKFDKYQRELRELQEMGRALPRDSDNRAGIAELFQRKKQQRDEEFSFLRGINGVTVTLWGTPPPIPTDVVATIVMERASGAGDGIVWPHWEINREGAIVGSANPPTSKVGSDGYPAGPTLNAGQYGLSGANSGGSLNPVTCDQSPPSGLRQPVCECYKRDFVFGIGSTETCVWVEGG